MNFFPLAVTHHISVSYLIEGLKVVENIIWDKSASHGGIWEQVPGGYKVVLNGISTSGMLRFETSSGEYFAVAVGQHTHNLGIQPWFSTIVDLTNSDTLQALIPTFYKGGSRDNTNSWDSELYSKTSSIGLKVSCELIKQEGATFWLSMKVHRN